MLARLTLLILLCVPMISFAQDAPRASASETPDRAQEFLAKMEEKNANVETLNAKFFQIRRNVMFDETFESSGEFWYKKPDLFRCDYDDPSPAKFYLVDNTGYFYTPENEHVEKLQLPKGDDAPIHGMLVGFGVSVDLINEVFEVSLSDEQPKRKNMLALTFDSKDMERSLQFSRITIIFDEKALEPVRLVMIDQSEDIIEIDIKKIKPNAQIDASRFEPKFPPNTTITEP